MRLSVIIIGYNSWHFLEQNLASLKFLFSRPETEIIYVDNGSIDQTTEKIRFLYPSIIIIENKENKGISIARNQGICRAKGEYIWLLDSDTEVSEASLDAMLRFMDEHPAAGLCGCKMYGQDGNIQESCRRFPSVKGKLQAAIRILAKKINLSFYNESQYNMDLKYPFEVDYVIGACQLIRKEAQEKIGYLDEHIFYGPEDADFCLRMKQAGYKVFYLPQISIYHAYQRVSSHQIFSKMNRKHLQGLLYYFRIHGGS